MMIRGGQGSHLNLPAPALSAAIGWAGIAWAHEDYTAAQAKRRLMALVGCGVGSGGRPLGTRALGQRGVVGIRMIMGQYHPADKCSAVAVDAACEIALPTEAKLPASPTFMQPAGSLRSWPRAD